MKEKKRTEFELVMVESGFSMRIWGLLVFIIGYAGLLLMLTSGKKLHTFPLVMSASFGTAGLLALVFCKHTLRYSFDRQNNLGVFTYPGLMSLTKTVKKFKLSEMESISSEYLSFASNALTSTRFPLRDSEGFFIKLKTGDFIESGLYSSSRKEMEEIIKTISDFNNISVI